MRQATVTLTFDDALDSHLDHAIPLLNSLGLKSTFYINISSECLGRRAAEWSKASSDGHELGNHSLLHPATSRKDWVREGNSIENYTLDRMRMELEVANNVLRMLDRKTERTFAFPCSTTCLGKAGWTKQILSVAGFDRTRLSALIDKWGLDFASSQKDYTNIIRELFFAARSGELPDIEKLSSSYERYHIPCITGDFRNSEQLLALVGKAIQAGTWIVFCFHGIGGGHGLYCELEAFEQFIKQLASNEQVVVKPLLEAAKDIWE